MILYTSNPYYQEIAPEMQNLLQWYANHYATDPEDVDVHVERVMKIVMKQLTDSGKYRDGNPRLWVDCLVAGCYLYYMFWEPDQPVSSLFVPRDLYEKYRDAVEFQKFSPSIVNALLETVESARGCNGKVLKCIPGPGTPADILATAIWYDENFG